MKTGARIGWIEASIRTLGHIDKKDYAHHFGISSTAVSRDIHEFAAEMNRRGGAVRIEAGKPHGRLPEPPTPGIPDAREILAASSTMGFRALSTEVRQAPPAEVLRSIASAIRRRMAVRFEYGGMRGGMAPRVLSPWRLVEVSGRLHVHGYDHGVNGPRDFILARISGTVAGAAATRWVPPPKDVMVTVEIMENPDLEEDRRLAVRADYGLDRNGRRIFRVPEHLAFYLRAEFGERTPGYVPSVLLV